MKKFSIGDSIAYIAINIASILIRLVPIRFGLWLGKGVGMLIYWFYPKRKRIAYANLKAAFGREKKPCQIKNILKNTYKNYGQTMVEFLRMPSMSEDYIKTHSIFEKLEQVRKGKERGKGVIYLTAHFGNWELSGLATAVNGYPIYVLARPQKMVKVNSLINRFRERFGCKVVNKGMASREIIRALKNNEIVGILSDQDAGKKGRFVNFFGRPTSCAAGAFGLARKTGAVIIPAFMVRKKGPHHVIKFEPFIEISSGRGPDSEREINEKLQEFTAIQESYIRRFPDQWLWVHKRWKSTPIQKVLILSDKKPGHLNQSRAILEMFKKARRKAGYGDNQTPVKFVDVEFRSPARKKLLGLWSLFASTDCQGCMRCLKFCLTQKSYNELIMDYADLVISCGSSLAAVNLFLSYENNARNVVIMKPGIVGIRRFNVAIIPEHDHPPRRSNVVITKGAPNSLNNKLLSQDGNRLAETIKPVKAKIIGLLLGGESDEYRLSTGFVDNLASQLEDLADRLDAEFLLTTSRRTPEEIDRYLEKRFAKHPRCRLLIMPNRSNVSGGVNGILGLSKLLLVSGDSISMISEAASCGKYVLVFDLEKKNSKITKHERLLEDLANSGFITRTPVDRITETALRVLEEKRPIKTLDDSEKIYKALYRII